MRHLITALIAGLMLIVATSARADDIVMNDQTLAQLSVEGMTLVSGVEGELIRGKSGNSGNSGNSPLVQFDLENPVLVDLNLAMATIMFVQTDLALDLDVPVFIGVNLKIGNINP